MLCKSTASVLPIASAVLQGNCEMEYRWFHLITSQTLNLAFIHVVEKADKDSCTLECDSRLFLKNSYWQLKQSCLEACTNRHHSSD